MKAIDIVIPLHTDGGFLGGDRELRFVLRSLCANFMAPFNLHIVSRALPAWLTGASLVRLEGGPAPKLQEAGRCFPEGFLWWYDDMALILPQGADDLKITTVRQGPGIMSMWGRSVDALLAKLREKGYSSFDYSRPHGPYWYTGPEVEEGFRTCERGSDIRFPTESWILNLARRAWRSDDGILSQYYGAFTPPAASSVFFNWNDGGCRPELVSWLDARFPDPCLFEKSPPDEKVDGKMRAGLHARGLRCG